MTTCFHAPTPCFLLQCDVMTLQPIKYGLVWSPSLVVAGTREMWLGCVSLAISGLEVIYPVCLNCLLLRMGGSCA